MTRRTHGFIPLLLAALFAAHPASGSVTRDGDPSQVITILTGDGAFVLHKFEQPIGKET